MSYIDTGLPDEPKLIDMADTLFNEMFGKVETPIGRVSYSKLCGHMPLEDIVSPWTLWLSATRCQRGFRNREDTQRFMASRTRNCCELAERIYNGRYKPKYYSTVHITERGKGRVIVPPAFECKVVQKCLSDFKLKPLLIPKMISTCYASVPGRGVDQMYNDVWKAVNHALRTREDDWCIVTGDYTGYFNSIETAKLREFVYERYIDDERTIRLLMSFCPDECGISLGNETSQIPASYYPSRLDHYVKEVFRYPFFRFMDDTLGVVPRDRVPEYISTYQHISQDVLGLVCGDEKFHVYPKGKDFVFCKENYRFVKPREKGEEHYRREINGKRVTVERRKLNRFCELVGSGQMSVDDALSQAMSAIGSIASNPRTAGEVENLMSIVDRICEFDGRDKNDYHFDCERHPYETDGSRVKRLAKVAHVKDRTYRFYDANDVTLRLDTKPKSQARIVKVNETDGSVIPVEK